MTDWASIRLVVFDVDGTLYQQRLLRWTMFTLLLRDAIATRSTRTMRILTDYRKTRERFADARIEQFDEKLLVEVAARAGVAPITVKELVDTWVETRPLALLRRTMVPGVEEVFAGLRRSGRSIGIFSDYPAARKLEALGLAADHIVAARDVGVMKPDPRGLEALMAAAGVTAAQTLMIGDRVERDVAAAQACGVAALLRTRATVPGQCCFADFRDSRFVGISAPFDP